MYKIASLQKLLPLVLSLTIALALAVAPTAARASADVARSTGGTLYADWSSTDPSGCVLTTALAQAGESTVRDDGTTSTNASAFISVFQFNFCTNEYLYGFGVTLSPRFAIDGALKGGSLQGDVQVCGASSVSGDVCFPVSFDLTWSSTSELTRVNDVSQTRVGNMIVVNHFNGSSRTATAFGTITGASVSWVHNKSQNAFIGFALANSVTIN